MKGREGDTGDQSQPGCNVNSTFNFTVGVLAVVAAIVIGYFIYRLMN